ncbi:CPBP family intramembrane glutamic endopeptidase [Dyadobacter frigoris]|uniref:CPBP family intramembrane metalloprotease n=1 Tax=Dyadobacter frigoris TaxID=2576211 RepID=A0A4U6D8K5_9BACT|nr:CPBP family intramembrane glutamic endopeptidase [Dyadobacter frigoris]TKT93096.1 CPBP family intramembrane metalloprotease [Dyadobacter frigoris]GLU55971.1 hypothetical protein Dfri01_54320 [Dyadobacter frigoris]
MIIHFKYLVGHFIQFIKNPNHPDYKTLSFRQKLTDVGLYYLVFSILLCVLIGSMVEFLKEFSFLHTLKLIERKDVVLYLIFGAMIIAPLVEEGIFRLQLGNLRNKPYFKLLFYISALLFGWMHIFNFEFTSSHYAFIPIITLPQTVLGLILGHIRIIYGFWYGVLLHFLYNTVFVGAYFIFEIF